ncbi:MAG TPA: dienelactone hydrolase family protein [Actinomycetota bacterium]|nr:dienelactone hydrolase family protein [Actinomycetota bacterium]
MQQTEHEKYLVEEVGIDYADGLISRREAIRRLGMMGVGAMAASSLLAACANDAAESPRATATATASATATATATPSDPTAGALPSQDITFTGPNGDIFGAYAAAQNPQGAVLVIHENRGLKDHFKNVAGRLARDGYSALAIDLLSEEGGTATLNDDARAMAALGAAPASRFVADMKAGLDELQRRNPDAKLGIMGFCFGGGQVWNLLNAGEPRLAAAAPFYGTPPENPDFSNSEAAVLAVYGGRDTRVNATRDAAEAAVKEAGLENKFLVYEDADHAFFNDTGQRYNAEAATQVYRELLDWFEQHLA